MMIRLNTLDLTPWQIDQFEAVATSYDWFRPIAGDLANSYVLSWALLSDLHWFFFSDSVKILPMQQISAPARLNYLIISGLTRNQHIQQLRIQTRGSRVNSFMAALETVRMAISSLSGEIIELSAFLQKNSDQSQRIQSRLRVLETAVRSPWYGHCDLRVRGQLHGIFVLLSSKLSELDKECRSLLARLQRLWYTGVGTTMKKAIDERAEDTGSPEMILQQGDQASYLSGSLGGFLERAALLTDNPKLRIVANRALAIKRSGQLKTLPEEGDLLKGIRTSSILERILLEEWFGFFSPFRMWFYSRLVEEQLWSLDENRPISRGGLVICVDCSGSMEGLKEETAKALTLSFLERACARERDTCVILFGDRETVKRLTISKGLYTEKDLLEIVYTFFKTRTTDFSGALEEAVKWVDNNCEEADLLFITDGQGWADIGSVERIRTRKGLGKLNTWALLIGENGQSDQRVKEFADQVFWARELLN